MKKIKDWEFLIVYLLLIVLAEITAAYVEIQSGLIFHFILLCVFMIHNAFITKKKLFAHTLQWLFIRNEKKTSKLIQNLINENKRLSSMLLALSLVPMIRILSLVMPLYSFAPMYWFAIIGVAVYLAFITLKIQQKMPLSDIGFKYPKPKHLPLEIGIVILGVPLGIAEYYILKPDLIITSFSLFNIVIAFIIFLVAVGLMEEIIFRGLIQKNSISILGPWKGIIFTAIIFTALHVGNLSILDCLLVFVIGGGYGLIVYKTKTILGVTLSHTVVNMFLFIVCPLTLA